MQSFQDIFISYGRKDSLEFATRLNRLLLDRGFNVWFDYDDIPVGVDYQKQIDDGIERADNILFIISPHSINSPYCGLELELALKHQKRIIPWLHVERISHETWQQRTPQGSLADWEAYQAKGLHDHFVNMHPVLRKINWIYGREGQDDFEAAFAGLLEICDRHKEYVHQHTLLLIKALVWERNQKRSSYLLIGDDRLEAEAWLKTRFQDSQPPCVPSPLHCEFITESRKNADNLMTEVFLVYAEEDANIAAPIRHSLRRQGFTVWTKTHDVAAGTELQQVLDRGIEETNSVIYLLSQFALTSSWCQRAVTYALSLNKRIIPVLVEWIAPEDIPPNLRNIRYIDLTDNVETADYELDESQLLQVLHQNAAYHQTHKVFLVKALKWERQHRNPTLLLRGYNLRQAEAWLKLTQQMTAYPALPLQEAFIDESLRQPPGTSLDVFISYSRANSGFARKLNDALQMQGKRTWFDQENIIAGTADFQQEIYRGIESSHTFLFILSPRSIASPYCADEVEYAAKLNKRFVTLLYRPIDPTALHPELAKVQWLDFNRHEGDFLANFAELLRILDTDSEHLHSHTRLLLRAIEWDEKGRKESLLLREDELIQAEQWLAQSVGKPPQATELQHSYITTGRKVEDANNQATQILREAAQQGEQAQQRLQEAERSLQIATRKGRRRLLLGSIAGAIGLIMVSVASIQVWRIQNQIEMAEMQLKTVSAQEQFAEGNAFQALLSILEIRKMYHDRFEKRLLKPLRNSPTEKSNLQLAMMSAFQNITSGILEKNTLQGHQGTVWSISFSPDGQIIASGSEDHHLKLWSVSTGSEIRTLQGHQGPLWSISFSPDGQLLASGSADQTLKLWDVKTGQELRTLQGHQGGVTSLGFSPDGQTLASGSADQTLKLWDVKTGQELRTLQGHQGGVTSVSFSPDGQTLASGSADQSLKLWDTETGRLIRTISGHQATINSLDFSPDGQILASGSWDTSIKLWTVKTGALLNTLEGHKSTVTALDFSPDSQQLVSGSYDNQIKIWNLKTAQKIYTLQGHKNSIWTVRFSPDGQTLASGSSDQTIKFWSVKTNEDKHTLTAHQKGVNTVIFSPDGQTLASGSADQTIKLWATQTEQEIQTLKGHIDVVSALSFSFDGQTLASGSVDKTIKIWNLQMGKELRTLAGHTDAVSSLILSPDGQTLASGSVDKTIKIWDLQTAKELRTLKGHTGTVSSLILSPDGQMLVSGSADKSIKIWDLQTGKELRTLEGHQDVVSSLDFSPDAKTLASGSLDKLIKVWNIQTGQNLATFQGHQAGVTSIHFSPDGQTLVSSSWDQMIKLWNIKTGQSIHTFKGHQGPVWSVRFSPDGKTIASSSEDSTIKLWVWDFDRLTEMGCNWIQQYLITRPQQQDLCGSYIKS